LVNHFTTPKAAPLGTVMVMTKPAASLPTHDFKGFDDFIEVFRAGSHTDSKGRAQAFTTADLDQMVANVVLGKAPAVLGHPKDNDPAYGWASFKREGDVLLAKFDDVNPQFEKSVRDGAYRNRSVSVIRDPAHGWRVRHVGWLGAVPPAIDGLKPVSFGASEIDALEFSCEHDKGAVMALTQEDIDRAVAKARQEEIDKAAAAVAKAKADAEAQFSAQGKEVAELRAERVQERVATQINGWKAAGKVLPAEEAGLAEFMTGLEALTTEFSFSKGDGKVSKTPAQFFAEFMAARPAVVKLGGSQGNAGHDSDPGSTEVVSFNAPQGAEVNPERLALHGKALAYQASKPGTSYLDAVRAVAR